VKKNIHPDDALDILYGLPVTQATETISTASALGRVLACDIEATIAIPPFDRSPFDGYAFRGEDTVNATPENPVVLRITEEISAGISPTIEVTPGFAAKILTGAPIPKGADCTVKYETTEFTDTEVKISRHVKSGKDIVPAGEDVKLGSIIAHQGEVITPPLMGLIASVGLSEVSVFKLPCVALLNTGTELIEPGQQLLPAKIYNSNASTLSGYLQSLGVEVNNFGVVPDDVVAISERIEAALVVSDIVITTGGASVGDYDFMIHAAERLGAELLFWKTQIKPGGSVVVAVKDNKLILGLSGNPGSAVMFLLRCALPYIKKLRGLVNCLSSPLEVFLKEPFDKPCERIRLLRGHLEIVDGKAYFAEYGAQGGGDISSFFGADLLAEIPADSEPLSAGTLVKAWRL